jgi:hypothetical protein
MRSLFLIFALSVSLAANAAPVTWTIDSLLFDDGGTGSGTFSYDASTNAYSNIDILTIAGSDFGGASYSSVNPYGPNGAEYLVAMIVPLEGAPTLALSFAAPLTHAGGIITIGGGGEAICGQECMIPVFGLRDISSGQISAVPVPAAVWLFGSALAGLGWLKRRKTI